MVRATGEQSHDSQTVPFSNKHIRSRPSLNHHAGSAIHVSGSYLNHLQPEIAIDKYLATVGAKHRQD